MSLRTYMGILFAILIVVFAGFVSITIIQKSSNEMKEQIGYSLAGLSHQTQDKLDRFMWSRHGEITVLSKLRGFRNPEDPEHIGQILDELKRNISSFAWIGYVSPEGTVEAATDSILVGTDISERPVFT